VNAPPDEKIRIFHEEIIVWRKKCQDDEINSIEYVKKWIKISTNVLKLFLFLSTYISFNDY